MPSEEKNRMRNFLVFMVFVLVAFSLWMLKVLNEKYETDITVAVAVTGIPEGVELDVEEDGVELLVYVEDYGSKLLKYMFGDSPEVTVDYSEFKDDNGRLSIPVSLLENRVVSSLHQSTELQHFQNEVLEVRIKKNERYLPVDCMYDIAAVEHLELKSVKFEPEKVRVTAPPSFFYKNDAVEYEPIVADSVFKDTVFYVDALECGKYVDVEPQRVKVSVDIEPLAQIRIMVPLTRINVPADSLKALNLASVYNVPDSVAVKFEVSHKHSKQIDKKAFSVVLDFNDFARQDRKSPVYFYLKSFPKYLDANGISLEPASISLSEINLWERLQYSLWPER